MLGVGDARRDDEARGPDSGLLSHAYSGNRYDNHYLCTEVLSYLIITVFLRNTIGRVGTKKCATSFFITLCKMLKL
jgi:hypothetical protein